MTPRTGPRSRFSSLVACALLAGCSVPSHYVLVGADVPGLDATHDAAAETSVDGANDAANDAPARMDSVTDSVSRDVVSMDSLTDVPADAPADSGLFPGFPPTAGQSAVLCVMASSCYPDPTDNSTLSGCAEAWLSTVRSIRTGGQPDFSLLSFLAHIFNCTNTSFDCTSIGDCLAAGANTARCQVDGGSFDAYCDGNKVVNCNLTGPAIGFDCTDWGLNCLEDNSNGTRALCTNGIACDYSSFVPHCDGDVFVGCDVLSNVETPIPCSQAYPGTTCMTIATADGGTEPRCVPTGPPCMQSTPRCESADVLVECDEVSRHELRTDCRAQFGSSCDASSGTAQCATPGGRACDDAAQPPDICGGTGVIDVCVNGAFQPVSCSAVGKSSCVTFGNEVICQ